MTHYASSGTEIVTELTVKKARAENCLELKGRVCDYMYHDIEMSIIYKLSRGICRRGWNNRVQHMRAMIYALSPERWDSCRRHTRHTMQFTETRFKVKVSTAADHITSIASTHLYSIPTKQKNLINSQIILCWRQTPIYSYTYVVHSQYSLFLFFSRSIHSARLLTLDWPYRNIRNATAKLDLFSRCTPSRIEHTAFPKRTQEKS